MNILALDPAIKTGWAMVVDGNYTIGTLDCTASRAISAGDAYAELERFLMGRTLRFNNVKAIVIETPTPTNMRSAVIQHGFYAIPQLFAAKMGIGYTVVFPNEVKAFLGDYDVRRLYQPKELSEALNMLCCVDGAKIESCLYFNHWIGRMPIDDNEADAYAILRYYMFKMDIPTDK